MSTPAVTRDRLPVRPVAPDPRQQLADELQALHNAQLGLDPLLHAIETHDRVAAVECLLQVIDLHEHGREQDDQARGYVLVPYPLLTIAQARALAVNDPAPSLTYAAAAD